MKFDTNALALIRAYIDDSTDQRALNGLNSLYWSSLIDNILDVIHSGADIDQFLSIEKNFVNAGIIDEILKNNDDVYAVLAADVTGYPHLSVWRVTDWLKETLRKITSGDKKELIAHEIKTLQLQYKKAEYDVVAAQNVRKELLLRVFSDSKDAKTLACIENLVSVDTLTLQNLQTKKEIAKGIFYSVENRRDFVARTKQLQNETTRRDELFAQVKLAEDKSELRKFQTQINDILDLMISIRDSIAKKEKEQEEIEKDQSTLSPLEVENRIRSELEYMRDLLKLSAKRMHIESSPILRSAQPFFTIKELGACLDRILEFDPKVFNNDRVAIFGKPSIVLVPGNGNGLYDWKNNRFIIPLVPAGGNFMTSVATAIIEYRLDVDDEKKLINSYQKLPSMKNTRAMFALRDSLTKEYIKWMSSEYQGFKVLEKDQKIWFEHEIAPSKIDIYCPPQYQPFALSSEEFRNLLNTVEKILAESETNRNESNLWTAAILNYQQGKFVESFAYINELLASYPEHIFGYYNLGIIGMKITRKQDAIKGFNEFIKRKSQSWWASVARDHIRRLQIS